MRSARRWEVPMGEFTSPLGQLAEREQPDPDALDRTLREFDRRRRRRRVGGVVVGLGATLALIACGLAVGLHPGGSAAPGGSSSDAPTGSRQSAGPTPEPTVVVHPG